MMTSSDKRPLEFFSDLYQVEQYSKCSTSLNKIYKHNSLNSFFNQLKKQKKLIAEISKEMRKMDNIYQSNDPSMRRTKKEFDINYFIRQKKHKEVKPIIKSERTIQFERRMNSVKQIADKRNRIFKDKADIGRYFRNYDAISK